MVQWCHCHSTPPPPGRGSASSVQHGQESVSAQSDIGHLEVKSTFDIIIMFFLNICYYCVMMQDIAMTTNEQGMFVIPQLSYLAVINW